MGTNKDGLREYVINWKDLVDILLVDPENCHLYAESADQNLVNIKIVNEKNGESIGGDRVREFMRNYVKKINELSGSEANQVGKQFKILNQNDYKLRNENDRILNDRNDPSETKTSSIGNVSVNLDINNKFIVHGMAVIYKAFADICGENKLGEKNWSVHYFLKENYKEKIDSIFGSGNKQLVFTGSPGTGKTHAVQEYIRREALIQAIKKAIKCERKNAEDIIRNETEDKIKEYRKTAEKYYKFVNFHTSYDYTDFVEGIRPVSLPFEGEKDNDPKMKFVKLDGTFKEFCRVAEGDKDNRFFFMIDEINRADIAKVFGELLVCLEEGYRGKDHTVQTQYQNIPTARIVEDENGKKHLEYIADKGNDVFKDGFFVPENVYIIGTMNNIDRSVDTFDFALRRRFQWEEISANDQMLETAMSILWKNPENEFKQNSTELSRDDVTCAVNRLKRINKLIWDAKGQDNKYKKFGLNEDYHLGAAYLKRIKKGNDHKINYGIVWKNNLLPIIKEYVRGFDGRKDFIEDCKRAFCEDEQNTNVEK